MTDKFLDKKYKNINFNKPAPNEYFIRMVFESWVLFKNGDCDLRLLEGYSKSTDKYTEYHSKCLVGETILEALKRTIKETHLPEMTDIINIYDEGLTDKDKKGNILPKITVRINLEMRPLSDKEIDWHKNNNYGIIPQWLPIDVEKYLKITPHDDNEIFALNRLYVFNLFVDYMDPKVKLIEELLPGQVRNYKIWSDTDMGEGKILHRLKDEYSLIIIKCLFVRQKPIVLCRVVSKKNGNLNKVDLIALEVNELLANTSGKITHKKLTAKDEKLYKNWKEKFDYKKNNYIINF